jgi:hypothetical protein
MKLRCPECDYKREFYVEDGDPGCPECALKKATAAPKAKKDSTK